MSRNTSELLGQLKIDRDATPTANPPARRSLIVAAGAGVLGLLLGASTTALLGGEESAADAPPATLAPAAAEPAPGPATPSSSSNPSPIPSPLDELETVLNASGYITARRIATVSAEVMGLITSVTVEEGMQVEEGQVLARIDDAKARVNLDFALAQVDVVRAREASVVAQLEEARRQQVRYAGLMDSHYSSRAQLTESQAQVQSLQAQLASARADIEVAKLEVQRQRERLDDHTIRAPFAGVVIGKNAQAGEIVAPSAAGGGFTRTGICTIVDMDSLEIEVDVNEVFIGRVSPGQKVNANLDAYPEWNIPATVIAIIPTANRAKATVRVRIGINENDARILPDMGVRVAFLDKTP